MYALGRATTGLIRNLPPLPSPPPPPASDSQAAQTGTVVALPRRGGGMIFGVFDGAGRQRVQAGLVCHGGWAKAVRVSRGGTGSSRAAY